MLHVFKCNVSNCMFTSYVRYSHHRIFICVKLNDEACDVFNLSLNALKLELKCTLLLQPLLNISTLLLHPFNGLFSRTTWVSRHSGFYWSKRW